MRVLRCDVETSSLDAEFPINLPIRLLKIDVEGFEHHVLQGASRLLHERCIDILMLECSKEVYGSGWHEYLAEIKKVMELGYDLYTLNRAAKLIKLSFTRLLYAD